MIENNSVTVFSRFHPLINIENDIEFGTFEPNNFYEINRYLPNMTSVR